MVLSRWGIWIENYFRSGIKWLLRFELDCGRQAAKPRTRKSLSVVAEEVFFIPQSIGMGDLISVLQPGNSAKWLKRRRYVEEESDCARVVQTSRTVAWRNQATWNSKPTPSKGLPNTQVVAWKGNLVFSKEKGGQMTFTPNKILEMFAKRHGTKNKAYEILKRSISLELSGADKKKPSDFFPQYKRREKKNG